MLFACDDGVKRRIRKQKWEKIGRWGNERDTIFAKKMVGTLTVLGPNSKSFWVLFGGPYSKNELE